MVRKFVYHKQRIYEVGVVDSEFEGHKKYVLETDYAGMETTLRAQILTRNVHIEQLEAECARLDVELRLAKETLANIYSGTLVARATDKPGG